MMMSDIAKDRMTHSVRKRGSVSSLSGREFRQKELHGYTKKSSQNPRWLLNSCHHIHIPVIEDINRLLLNEFILLRKLSQDFNKNFHLHLIGLQATCHNSTEDIQEFVFSVERNIPTNLEFCYQGRRKEHWRANGRQSPPRCLPQLSSQQWCFGNSLDFQKNRGSRSTVSYTDEPSQGDDASRLTVQMENTYQLGPTKHFPVVIVNQILKDVLTNYLQEEQYEPELCRQMAKTISEVIKTQVKDLMIPRYKLIVIVHIGQLNSQSILIGSRCLWDPKSDTFSSSVFRNSSLFAVASVYAVYFE